MRRYWWIIIVGLMVPLFYAVFRATAVSFLDGFIGNWLATVLGLMFGIPIGLEVERLQSQKESKNRKLKILELVKKELNFNHGLISKNWVGKDPIERGSFIGGNLKDELWNAFSASLITPRSLSSQITTKINQVADGMGGMTEVMIESAIDAIVNEQKQLKPLS